MPNNDEYRREIEKLKSEQRGPSLKGSISKLRRAFPVILLLWIIASIGTLVYAWNISNGKYGSGGLVSVLPLPLKVIVFGGFLIILGSIIYFSMSIEDTPENREFFDTYHYYYDKNVRKR